jgi:hypothetical protein
VTVGGSAPPGPVIAAVDEDRAVAATDAVFQVVKDAHVDPARNLLAIHTWGDGGCCLPRGATTVDLVGEVALKPGDLLLLEEVRGQATGLPEDADPGHRQVVRLTGVTVVEDPLMTLRQGRPARRRPYQPRLKVTRVSWADDDALTFPLCVSQVVDGAPRDGISVVRGNLAQADHGRTVSERHAIPETAAGGVSSRIRLREGPLTFRAGSLPQVTLDVASDTENQPGWLPVADLLDSDPFAREFVVEVGRDGRALLRFGDDQFGQAPPAHSTATVTYRVGNGVAGNVGPEALAHLVVPDPLPAHWPEVTAVRNPLAAAGGSDPETIEQVRRLAPAAFHAELFRAVTEADYAQAAEKLPEVSRATATFRWTGSWYTVFVTVDPRGTDELDERLRQRVRDFLTRYRQTGYDLEVDPPVYVPLEIEIEVCVAPDHFAGDVRRALLEALGDFFHPDNFTFGQAVYLSRLYAAVESVEGVDSAEVVTFKRYGQEPAGELALARIELDRLEIARLDNDPSRPENGLLTLTMLGGK